MSKSNKNDRQRRKRNEKHRQTKQRQESLCREQAKKRDEPNLRLVSEPSVGSDSPPSPPSRMSMERTMRDLQQALESQDFSGKGDMQAFIDEFNARGCSPSPMTRGGVTALPYRLGCLRMVRLDKPER